MDISVLTPTWNNSGQLGKTLDSFSGCRVPAGVRWELVLVNNNCTDNTEEVVRRFTSLLPMVYVREPEQGLSRARNAGLKAASGRLIIFADDDVRLSPEWLAAYWSAYLEMPAGFYFGGPIQPEYEAAPPEEELLRMAPPSVRGLDFGPEPRKLAMNEFFIGPNWACPADALRAVGPYDETLSLNPALGEVRTGEETDLMRRLQQNGWSGWYLPAARVTHFVPAGKCTLKHIAGRLEAYETYLARLSFDGPPAKAIGGVPRWIYREVATRWLKWILARVRGEKGYKEYVAYRRIIGNMKPYLRKSPGIATGRAAAGSPAGRSTP